MTSQRPLCALFSCPLFTDLADSENVPMHGMHVSPLSRGCKNSNHVIKQEQILLHANANINARMYAGMRVHREKKKNPAENVRKNILWLHLKLSNDGSRTCELSERWLWLLK